MLITMIKVIKLNKSNVPWPSKFLGWCCCCCCCCCLSCFVFVFHLPSLSIEHHLLQLIPSKGVSLSWASLSPRREIFNHFLPTLKIANKGWKLHSKAENCIKSFSKRKKLTSKAIYCWGSGLSQELWFYRLLDLYFSLTIWWL